MGIETPIGEENIMAEGLGKKFDIGSGISPLDLQTARTGARCSLKNAQSVSIVVFKGAGTAGDDPTFTLKQHTASSSGTTANLAVIDHYYLKNEATLDNDETWTKVTQSAAATIADPGGAGTSAESEQLIVIEVDADQLTDGYSYISLDCADTGTNAQLGAVLYLLHDLRIKRAPANMAAPLS